MKEAENKPTTRVATQRRPEGTSSDSPALDRAKRIAFCVVKMGEAYNRQASEMTHAVYAEALDDIPIERIEDAFRKSARESRFMPTPAEIRSLAGVVTPDARATKAWLVAKTAVPVWGSYRSVDFDDPVVNATVRALGGWVEFCGTPAGEKTDTWLRKNFEATYKTLMSSGVSADDVRPLRGLCAVENGASGHDGPAVVRIACGLPEHAKRLVNSGESGGRSAGYLGADAKRIGRIE